MEQAGGTGVSFSADSVAAKVARLNLDGVRMDPRLVVKHAETPAFEVLRGRPDAILRPGLIRVADKILLPQQGVPREELKVPVSAADEPVDTELFEDPAAPERRFYLPRYRVARAEDRFRIVLLEVEGGWQLDIDLEKFLPPELEQTGREAAELPHTIDVVLRYSLPVASSKGSARIETAATLSETDDGLVRASFTVAQPDELILALSDVDRLTSRVVRRFAATADSTVPSRIEPNRTAGRRKPRSSGAFEWAILGSNQ